MYKIDWPQNEFRLNFLYCNQEDKVTDKASVFGQAFWFCQQFDETMNKGFTVWN